MRVLVLSADVKNEKRAGNSTDTLYLELAYCLILVEVNIFHHCTVILLGCPY